MLKQIEVKVYIQRSVTRMLDLVHVKHQDDGWVLKNYFNGNIK